MNIKVIKRIEKDGRITGVFDYGTLGGISELTIDLDTVKTAKNFEDHSERLNTLFENSKPAEPIGGVFSNFNDDFEKKVKIFGKDIVDLKAVEQLKNCLIEDSIGVITADGHVGYSMPVGGVIGYKNFISPTGVGYDIACGNMAVQTNIKSSDIDIKKIMNEIEKKVGFGVGRPNPKPINHSVFDKIAHANFEPQRNLLSVAQPQLGTVGSGNHYCNLFKDENDNVWIGVHFGSRGFGHKTASGFIALANGKKFGESHSEGEMFSRPLLFDINSALGQDYIEAMQLAGEYAYAGRETVINIVLGILGAKSIYEVHNHHNFAWFEEHFGEKYWVVRKGATPAFPGQQGFIGANMFDNSVIVEGIDSEESKQGLYSTVHGAGRILSRRKAAGKTKWQKVGNKKMQVQISPGLVNFSETKKRAKDLGVELRGGGADESPECYKKLDDVLKAHGNTIKILHTLKPIGVIMANEKIYDPYKDG